jgi:predicted amidohydrolase YtcJ
VRVVVTGAPSLDPDAAPGLERGPVKVVVADHCLPSIDDLIVAFRSARRQRRPVAVHCVTRVALVLALAAWHDVGSVTGDRIEHGAVIPLEFVADIRELGLSVVTQPSFVSERGDDYRRDVDAADQDDLGRCRRLLDGEYPSAAAPTRRMAPPIRGRRCGPRSPARRRRARCSDRPSDLTPAER